MNSRFAPLAVIAAALLVLSGCAGVERREDRRDDRQDRREDRRDDRRDFIGQGQSGIYSLGENAGTHLV